MMYASIIEDGFADSIDIHCHYCLKKFGGNCETGCDEQ